MGTIGVAKNSALEQGTTMSIVRNLFSSARQSPRENHLLGALPPADYERLVPHLELVPLPVGRAVHEAGDAQGYVIFPATGIVSLVYGMQDGSSTAMALVGNEGLVGVALVMQGESTPTHAMVKNAGYGYRLRASAVKTQFSQGGDLQRLALRYTQALITQIALTAVCNRHHTVEQQLCRLLLLSLDRLPSNMVSMTQELLANMLGVRREGVTDAACKLQAAGLIHYKRGHITVLDRPKLEARVCECYAVVKREYERLLPEVPALRRDVVVPQCLQHARARRAPAPLVSTGLLEPGQPPRESTRSSSAGT
jgi:CRP-like cAMP-binding protein